MSAQQKNNLKTHLTVGGLYKKKELSVLLNEKTLASCREGIFNCKKTNNTMFFVTLDKSTKDKKIKYNDFFMDNFFYWESQNKQHAGTPGIKRIISGETRTHLFCRTKQKSKNLTNPFVYCGELKYVSYDENTSNPVRILFKNTDYEHSTNQASLLGVYQWSQQPTYTPGQKVLLRSKKRKIYQKTRYLTQKQKVLDVLGKKETASIKEITKLLGFPEPTIRRILGQGAKTGELKRVRSGVYTIKKEVAEPPQPHPNFDPQKLEDQLSIFRRLTKSIFYPADDTLTGEFIWQKKIIFDPCFKLEQTLKKMVLEGFRPEFVLFDEKGFGAGKKNKIVDLFKKIYSDAQKIHYSENKETILYSIEQGWLKLKNIELLLDEKKLTTSFKSLELASLVLKEKERQVFLDMLTKKTKAEVAKKNNLTSERVRQLSVRIINNPRLEAAFNYFNKLKQFKINSQETGAEEGLTLLYDKIPGIENGTKDIPQVILPSTPKRGLGKRGPNKKRFLNTLLKKLKANNKENHFFVDVYKNKTPLYKAQNHNTIKSFYLRTETYKILQKDIDRFYAEIFKKNTIIVKSSLKKTMISFLETFKEHLFDLNKVHFTEKYIYQKQNISIPQLAEMAIEKSQSETKTLRIEEIFSWIKINFPQKKLTSIGGLRGSIMRSKKIIAFGKTGNYGLSKSFKGLNKNKDLDTKNIIKKLLLKTPNPLRMEDIENHVKKTNPFLKDRGVDMIIEINPSMFIKFKRTYVGLRKKSYKTEPISFSRAGVLSYLRSKDLNKEWVSLTYLTKETKIPGFQLKDFIKKQGLMVCGELITKATGNKEKDNLIAKLVEDKNLIKETHSYKNLSFENKTIFKRRLKKIIKTQWNQEMNNNEISKIINHIL